MSEGKEYARAAREVAKTTGKCLDASRQFGEFLSRFIGGPLEQGVGIFEDKLKYMRWERQVRLMRRADEFLASQRVNEPARPLPMKIAVPFFQAASLEEDDYLQDMWVKLLVNGTTKDGGFEVARTYVDILERLTHLEARILERIYEEPFDNLEHFSIATAGLPDTIRLVGETELNELPYPSEEIKLALANLVRMGCVGLHTTWGGGQVFSSVVPTLLGSSFVAACSLPNKRKI